MGFDHRRAMRRKPQRIAEARSRHRSGWYPRPIHRSDLERMTATFVEVMNHARITFDSLVQAIKEFGAEWRKAEA